MSKPYCFKNNQRISQKYIASYLGLTSYYRKFIEEFCKLKLSLTKLTHKPFEYNETSKSDFQELKKKNNICTYFDPS